MSKFRLPSLAIFLVLSLVTSAQFSYSISLKSKTINDLPGVQSYAVAEHNGKWLIVGGRTDGLHQRQPFASFLASDNNDQLIVIDPENEQYWTASLSTLPTAISEQLQSTNMNFQHYGDYLYCVGGYGYSATAGDHITHDKLTALHLSNVINSIVQNQPISSHIRQISHANFAVAGGRLQLIDTTFYLLGGQKFTGRYNPMGPGHGPGFIQNYTNAVRRFTLHDDGTNISINHLPAYSSAADLHRRDFNAEPQIMPNGKQGVTMFSGVFQDPSDLPYLNCVNVSDTGYTLNDSFSQYLNHYHCASAPLYDATSQAMHTLFFGGIAQFYMDGEQMIQDDDVPFVNTIGRVTRDADGLMAEYKMDASLPGLLGAGSEFIPAQNVPMYSNGVIKLNELVGDSTLIGYVYGGIESSAPNIFFVNDGSQSSASSNIYAVYLVKHSTGSTGFLNHSSIKGYQVQVYPNPSPQQFTLQYFLDKSESLTLTIADIYGKTVFSETIQNSLAGLNTHTVKLNQNASGSSYFITVQGKSHKQTLKLIMN